MADYIDRQDAIDMFENLSYEDWNQGASTTWANAFSECADMIRELPSADVQLVRHGHWIEEPNCMYRCSSCGSHYPSIKGYMDFCYCPSCGERKEAAAYGNVY